MITAKASQPRSYYIKTGNNIIRRNSKHILKTKTKTEDNTLSSDSNSSLIATPPHHNSDNTPVPTASDSDSDATIPFADSDDDQPTRNRYTGRIIKPPRHLQDFITK